MAVNYSMGQTQNERILAHLREFGSITPLEAMKEYGIMRLASRIYDLKKAGHNIKREFATSNNRFGEIERYAKYRLEADR